MLVLNVKSSGFQGGDGSRYVLGSFDGYKFVTDKEEDAKVRWLDYGADFTSVATFFDFGLNPSLRTGLAWMSSSRYFTKLPTTDFRGQLTIPRDFTLREYNK